MAYQLTVKRVAKGFRAWSQVLRFNSRAILSLEENEGNVTELEAFT